ncbi:putative G-protein coupled receptor B0563.6 [Amphibalanus amphitrite]|uniref:Putative G-protein coupled receptor B0563.6 n=1 Tax=Amphibalanus amphitrite TaxID=1232801 RepID=A0A6A4UZL6_AMPAM|nr:putative G-protein coupled receptor B0563.6 [Amphibalanus amphitrite]
MAYNGTTEPISDILFMEYVAYNIIVPTVSACGVLGNILNLLVLTRGQMKAPIYIYFTTLAVADLVTCLLVFFSGIAKGAAAASFWWQVFEVYFYLGIGSISTTVSIATIVMVTVERLILIRNGQSAKTYCTREMAWRVCLVIFPVSIVFNIPYFLAFVVDDGIQETPFYRGQYYQIHNWIRFVVFGLGTALFLAVGNLLLILSLRQSYRHRKTLLSQRKLREEKRLKEQTRLTATLVGIIVLFLIGEFPTHLASRQSAATLIYGGDTSQLSSDGYRTFKLVVSVLMAVHYSCNFILYCALNSKFLSMVSRVLLCLRAEPELETSDLRVTASDPARGMNVRAQGARRMSAGRAAAPASPGQTGSGHTSPPKAHLGGNGHAL